MFKMKDKKGKLETPAWIKEGYDSPAEYEKEMGKKTGKKIGKVFKIKKCPKCSSDDVLVVLTGEEGKGRGEWGCKKCGWKGTGIVIQDVDEDEFMKYLDEKGEDVA